MKTLLQLNTSLFGKNGSSSELNRRFVAAWRAANPDGAVVLRDLAATPIPHLTAEGFLGFAAGAGERTPEQSAAAELSDTLIAELKRADVIALGLPMYNFGVPSTLKAWFDHVARAGVTFRYTANGPEGLLQGRRAYIFATRGGVYAGTPSDTQSAYVRYFFNFLGIRDVEFVFAEGLALGDESREGALAKAHREIDGIGYALPQAASA